MTGSVSGFTGFSGLERIIRKIEEVHERFQTIQDSPSFRSALSKAQERQSTDGKTKDGVPVPHSKMESEGQANAAPGGGMSRTPAASGSMEKRMMETLRRELPKYNVPPDLALAVMQAESNFNPRAVSPKGAIGVMQLMPQTAAGLGVGNPEDLFEPEVNIPTGLQHLSNLLSKYSGDEKLALAAYNAGTGAVGRYGGVPPFAETKDYIRKVFDIRQKLNEGSSS